MYSCSYVYSALINATSFFLSRLAGSPLYPTFSSSLSSVYTLTNLTCQFYCTITSKQVRSSQLTDREHSRFRVSQSSPSRRIFVSITVTILLVTSLCFSTFIRGTPLAFFSFALFNAASLAVTTGYLCTAVYAGAALFGTSFLQTVISGQAAIAVAVSVVQVASSMLSIWGSSSTSVTMEVIRTDGDSQAADTAARIFFGVSAIFLGMTLVAYAWLTRQSFYKSVTSILEQHRQVASTDEFTRLVADDCEYRTTGSNLHVYRVFKQNWMYMFSVAYVFAVTLVSAHFVTIITLILMGSLTGGLPCDYSPRAVRESTHPPSALHFSPLLGF